MSLFLASGAIKGCTCDAKTMAHAMYMDVSPPIDTYLKICPFSAFLSLHDIAYARSIVSAYVAVTNRKNKSILLEGGGEFPRRCSAQKENVVVIE